MTFDYWSNIVTANVYWMHLVLVMVILVVFYRQYREIHIRKECELLARIEIENQQHTGTFLPPSNQKSKKLKRSL